MSSVLSELSKLLSPFKLLLLLPLLKLSASWRALRLFGALSVLFVTFRSSIWPIRTSVPNHGSLSPLTSWPPANLFIRTEFRLPHALNAISGWIFGRNHFNICFSTSKRICKERNFCTSIHISVRTQRRRSKESQKINKKFLAEAHQRGTSVDSTCLRRWAKEERAYEYFLSIK